MDAVFAREIRREHGAVKGRHLYLIEQPEMQRGQVAIADERLDVFCYQVEVQIFQEIIRTIAAARAENGALQIVGKGLMQIAEAHGRRAGKVKRTTRHHILRGLRRITQGAQRSQAAVDALLLRR